MKRGIYSILLTMLFISISQFAWANINVSTGLDTSFAVESNGQVDAHWVIGPTGAAAYTIAPGGADWWGDYVANSSTSAWISNNATTDVNGPAPYSFNRTFDLTGYNLSTVSLSGNWAIADGGSLLLNGNTIASLPAQTDSDWSQFHSFSITSGFNAGLNTLTLEVTASDNLFEAARLDGTVIGQTTGVPEPATMLLLGLGMAGLIGVRKFRK